MRRRIFVGSSSEALDRARHICDVLSTVEDVRGHLWTEIFEPGFLTLEALELMLNQCCAAVFVATPDDEILIRGRTVRSPRANIMLEFGLVAGRLGHHSVAVCQYGDAELPSDLAGLTVIRMDPPDDQANAKLFRQRAEEQLKLWSSRLLATVEGIPRTDTVHGYTGRWHFDLTLHRWRDLRVVSPGYVLVKGYLDLFLPAGGEAGRGLAHGRLHFKLPRPGSETEVYNGEFRTAHEIVSAVCGKDGSIELTTEAFALQKIQAIGTAPPELVGIENLPEPWSARWKLSPTAGTRALVGTVKTAGSIVSEGIVTATKNPEHF